jgi:DUF1016 N-terminal domain
MKNKSDISFLLIKEIKQQIISSRYIVAKLANAESIRLYYNIGKLLQHRFSEEKWGTKILENISTQLQQECQDLEDFLLRI